MQYPLLDQVSSENPEVRFLLRQTEYTEVLSKNLAHPEVSQIHLLYESEQTHRYIAGLNLTDPCGKLHYSPLGHRMKYRDAFEYGNGAAFRGKMVMIMNADIYLGQGFDLIADPDLTNTVFALTRHEQNPGPAWEGKCGLDLCEHYRNAKGGYLSHDAFLFLSPIRPEFPPRVDFLPNLMGAENVVVHELKKLGYRLANPCKTLWTYHHHCSNVRPDLTKVVAVIAPDAPTTTASPSTAAPKRPEKFGPYAAPSATTKDAAKQTATKKGEAPRKAGEYKASERETSYKVTQERIDLKRCGTIHCGDGWVGDGPTFLVKGSRP